MKQPNRFLNLTDEQILKFEAWEKTLTPATGYQGAIGVGFEWNVLETSIGDMVTVKYHGQQLWLEEP